MNDRPYPGSIISDRHGIPLQQGNKVAFSSVNHVYVGSVAYFTPKGITCEYVDPRNNKKLINVKFKSRIIRL